MTVGADFRQIQWDEALEQSCGRIVRLAIEEDLGTAGDLTSRALVPDRIGGSAQIAARAPGILAGLPAASVVAAQIDPQLELLGIADDGEAVEAGDNLVIISGPARSILAAERIMLNLVGRLSGIATLARLYVDRVKGTSARIYDTRKTTPGYRLLEKYAARVGGAHNHRLGLYDAVLIKDNHLALGRQGIRGGAGYSAAQAIAEVRRHLEQLGTSQRAEAAIVEIELDSLENFEAVLAARPDIVLLDNMTPAVLAEAVRRRNASAPQVELEASGGVRLETVEAIARSGVDRISVGALTHSARALDVGLDWIE